MKRLDVKIKQRIHRAVAELKQLDDATKRLEPYSEGLKGLWKLRVGDYRLICDLRRDDLGQLVIIIQAVHCSKAYIARNV